MSGGGSDVASIVWLEGGGCDGCTMSVLGATSPRLEELIEGTLTRGHIDLIHPALALESGRAYIASLEQVERGERSPFILVLEGSLFDEELAGEGTFSGLGQRDGQPIAVGEWVSRLVPQAAAVIAIGTCAAWGGIPAARGSVTGAMGLGAFLGEGFRSASGLPVINVPGCPPGGDSFIEVLSYVLLHLDELVPLDLDDQNRPRWLYSEATPLQRPRLPHVGRDIAEDLTAPCSVPSKGWINRLGGCAAVGGSCNGCTRPDFPDLTIRLVSPTRS